MQKYCVGLGKIGANILAITLSSLLLVSLLFPLQTEAGIFSFVTNLFSSEEDSKVENSLNSQNMALLQASISPNLEASSTKSELSILSDSAILPESQGPFSDGKDHSVDQDQISIYVVREGDTLPAIAKMFGVSTNTIVWANDLKGNKITKDQTLVILPISGVQHTVKKGDTLKSISTKYKGDLDEIAQYNNLSLDSKLSVGDVIFIPDGEITPTKSSGSSSSKSTPSYSGYYMRPIVGGIRTQGLHGHNGVDLASSYGAKIMASASGTVLVARSGGWNGGYGSYVVIKHSNGTQTLYAHLSGVAVAAGQNVDQGQAIGYMGSTGKSTGTHLHFEVRGAKNPF